MVSLVLVSHSHALAKAATELVKGVNQNIDFPIAYAGGAGDDHEILGTNAAEIMEAIVSVYSDDGVLVLMDLGSAVISAKLAIEMLEDGYEKVRLCPAPIVEGAVSAAVQILAGSPLEEICAEAMESLGAKQADLGMAVTSVPPAAPVPEGEAISYTFRMGLAHGLHTRPAADMVNTLAPFKAVVTALNLTKQTPPVNAKSLNKLALSNITFGDEVQVSAMGDDAEAAVEAVKALAHNSFAADSAPVPAKKIVTEARPRQLGMISPGVAVGLIYHANTSMKAFAPRPVEDTAAEEARLDKAVEAVGESIRATRQRLADQGLTQEAAIFDAHLMILRDSEVLTDVKSRIESEKLSAEYVYQQKMSRLAGEFRGMENGYMQERATDVADVARQVVAQLTGDVQAVDSCGEDIILAAREVTPSLLGRWDKDRLKGVLTEIGGASSHVAIIAKAMSIPAITGYKMPDEDMTGKNAVMDASRLEVVIDPAPDVLERYNKLVEDWEDSKKADATDSQGQAISADGVYVPIYGNVGDQATALAAVNNGAEGIGLLRTEFMFLNRRLEPSEDEQASALGDILDLFKDKIVTIRTLDIGGDKQLDWLPLPKEDNPFLGVRGIRLCMQKKDLFLRQLRAILRAADGHEGVKIMIPMVSVTEEVHFARTMLEEAHASLEKDKIAHRWPVPLGIMVETPSSVLLADYLAKVSDFFSIGTNDLSQYIMCAERGGLSFEAGLMDIFQPPVLKSIEMLAAAAHKHKIELSVCGEMAGDPAAAKMLLGLGVDVLSMNGSSIGRVKRMIRKMALKPAAELAHKAADAETPLQARQILSDS